MITSIDSVSNEIDITIDRKEAEAVLRALYVGVGNIPKDRKAASRELQSALFAFLYPPTPNTSEPEETL